MYGEGKNVLVRMTPDTPDSDGENEKNIVIFSHS